MRPDPVAQIEQILEALGCSAILPGMEEQQKTGRARALRQHMPEAQRRMWRLLRDRRFAGYKFRREHPLGSYALDFYCAEAAVSLELDGRQHGFPERQARDRAKENYLLSRGIVTKRFWNWQVRQQPEVVKATLWRLLQERAPHPPNVPVTPEARSRTWPPKPAGTHATLRASRRPPRVGARQSAESRSNEPPHPSPRPSPH